MRFKNLLTGLVIIMGLSGFTFIDGFKRVTLKNGLRVYIKEDHKIPVVTMQLWVAAGSVDENAENNGISHFLEHMMFKGTENYSTSEISHIVESNGGYINAGTSKEFTYYYIDIPAEGFNDALGIISDLALQKATFPEEELERERNVILEEIKRADDDPDNVVHDKFNSQLFSVTPYKWRILGSSKSVSGISRQDLISYYRKYYIANNMILVIEGDIMLKNAKKTIMEMFNNAKTGSLFKKEDLIEPVKSSSFEIIQKDVQHSYVLLGFLGPEIDKEKYQYSGDVLSVILGSGRSSRLNKKLREEKQIVYGIGSSFYSQSGTGIFIISAMCDPDKLAEVRKEVGSEIDRILTDKVDEVEINRAKELIKSDWYFGHETYSQQANTVGFWSLLNKLDYARNYIKNIDRVKYEDLEVFLKIYYTGLTGTVVEPSK